MKVSTRIWEYVKKEKYLLILALILTLLSDLLSIFPPYYTGLAIDAFGEQAGNVDFNKVWYYFVLITSMYFFAGVSMYALSRIMIHISRKVTHQLRTDAFKKITELPVSYFDKNSAGDIISKVTYDIDTIQSVISDYALHLITMVLMISISLLMMLQISPLLTLIFSLCIPLSILYTKFMARKTRALYKKRSESYGNLNGFSEEIITGHTVVMAYNRQEAIKEIFKSKNDDAINGYLKSEIFSTTIGPTINAINNIGLVLVSTFGSIFFISNLITAGQITSFILYSRKFSGPINDIAGIISEFQSAISAGERIFTLLDLPSEKGIALPQKGETEKLSTPNKVEFANVSFGYEENKNIIQNLSFSVKDGENIAIIGPTGAGKTTIINLLMKFYEVNSGSIYIDGKNVNEYNIVELRKKFSIVLQDSWLFHGTFFENIAYGKQDATLDEVIQAAKSARIHNFISKLPNGYDTVLDDSINISAGQKQLVTIARAILSESEMLILDEATSNVDTNTEIEIQKAMKNLMKGKTTFVIAHRLSTIRNANNIILISSGNISEQGTHEELMKLDGIYAGMTLAHSQNS